MKRLLAAIALGIAFPVLPSTSQNVPAETTKQAAISDSNATHIEQVPQAEIRGVPYTDRIREAKSYQDLSDIRNEILGRTDIPTEEKTRLFEELSSETTNRIQGDFYRQTAELWTKGIAGMTLETAGLMCRLPVVGDVLFTWGQGLINEDSAVEILEDMQSAVITGLLFHGIGSRVGELAQPIADRIGEVVRPVARTVANNYLLRRNTIVSQVLRRESDKTLRRILKEIRRTPDGNLSRVELLVKELQDGRLITPWVQELATTAAPTIVDLFTQLLTSPFQRALSDFTRDSRERQDAVLEYEWLLTLRGAGIDVQDGEIQAARIAVLSQLGDVAERTRLNGILVDVEQFTAMSNGERLQVIGQDIASQIQSRLQAAGYPEQAIAAAVETALVRLSSAGDRVGETAEKIRQDLERLENAAKALGPDWSNDAEKTNRASVLVGAIGSLVGVLQDIDWENIGKEFFVPVSDIAAVKTYAEAGIISTHWPGIPSPAYGSRFSACDKKAIFGMGLLSGDVYHDGDARAPDGYRTVNDSGELQRLLGKDNGFSVDEKGQITKSGLGWFSGFDASIYEAPDGSLVLAFRGSKSLSDYYADLAQWAPWTPDQYSLAASMLRSLLENTDKKITVVGHSLGGALTQYAMGENNLDGRVTGYTFNSAGLSWSTIKGLDKDRADEAGKNLVNVRNDGDGVSPIGWHLGQIYDVENQNSSGHGLGKSTDVWYHPERATSIDELEPVYDGFLGNLQKAADGGAGVCPCGLSCACNPCRNLRKAEPDENSPDDDAPADDTGGVDDGGPTDSTGDADAPDDGSSTDPSGTDGDNDGSFGFDGHCQCSISVGKRAELSQLKRRLEAAEQQRIYAENRAKNIWWKLLSVVLEPFPGLMEKAGGVVAGDWGEESIKTLNRAAQMYFDGEIDVEKLATTVLESLKIGMENTLTDSDKKSSWWKWICHPIDTISKWVDKLEGALEYGKKLGETIAEIVITRKELEKAENQLKDITNRYNLAFLEFSDNSGCYCAPGCGCQCPHCKYGSDHSGSGGTNNPPEDDDPWTGGGGWGGEPPVDVVVVPGVGGSRGGDDDGLGELVSELGGLLDDIGDGSGLVNVTIPDFGLSGSDNPLVPDNIGDPDITFTASGILNTSLINAGRGNQGSVVDGNNGGGKRKRKPGDIGGRGQKEVYSSPKP